MDTQTQGQTGGQQPDDKLYQIRSFELNALDPDEVTKLLGGRARCVKERGIPVWTVVLPDHSGFSIASYAVVGDLVRVLEAYEKNTTDRAPEVEGMVNVLKLAEEARNN